MKKLIFSILILINLSLVLAWDITITAENQLEPVVIGVDKDATPDYDPNLDAYSSTPITNKVIMSVNNAYSKNYIGKTDEPNWNILVGVPNGQTTELEWNLNNIPLDLDLSLIYNLNIINMKKQKSLQLNEGSYTLLVEVKTKDTADDVPSSSGGGRTSSFKQIFKQDNALSGTGDDIIRMKDEKTEEDLRLKNIPSGVAIIEKDTQEEKQTEQIETDKELQRSAFIGISIIISIIIIGLLTYFIITGVIRGIKNE